MLKRTLLFQSPGYLSLALDQLCFTDRQGEKKTVPIEDIGIVVIESQQLTITSALLSALAGSNVGVIFCNAQHLPDASLLPYAGNSLTQKITIAQIESTIALRDRLWKQVVCAKIRNQAECLDRCGKNGAGLLRKLTDKVKNGDPENAEAVAARFYFQAQTPLQDFLRLPEGPMPNPALNYGYALLRAAMARALTASGLLTLIGIHHHGQYNAFCLADDMMEPYRPFVDELIFSPKTETLFQQENELTVEMKKALLSLLAADVSMGGRRIPLMSALSQTTASLSRCFLKKEKILALPEFS